MWLLNFSLGAYEYFKIFFFKIRFENWNALDLVGLEPRVLIFHALVVRLYTSQNLSPQTDF